MTAASELGQFLRARRSEVSPAVAGLPDVGARQVVGLRREEVAELAGVSTDYYTRLEQGRERRPSAQVLTAIARALQLSSDATDYLFKIVQPPPGKPGGSPAQASQELRDLVAHAITTPATICGPALDVLYANRQARALYGQFAAFDNLPRMIFLDPAARDFYHDWGKAARGVVSNLRAASAPFASDPRVTAIIDELTARSPAFAELWNRLEVEPRTSEGKVLHHAQVGTLYLHYQAVAVAAAPGQQVFVYTATPGSPSADALTLLAHLASEMNEV